jgi:hypothetical protein
MLQKTTCKITLPQSKMTWNICFDHQHPIALLQLKTAKNKYLVPSESLSIKLIFYKKLMLDS